MALLKCRYINILEAGTVTLATGTESEDFPLYRLNNRNIDLMFAPAAAETIRIKVDQGGSPIAIDSLTIPGGHNLAGMTLDIMYSDTDGGDGNYTQAVAQWVGEAGVIVKEWASAAHRWWIFKITSPAAIPQIAEIFLSPTYVWERNPSRPTGPQDQVTNVQRLVSASGTPRYAVMGDAKRRRSYQYSGIGSTQRANLEALYDAWAGCRPFWLCDHEGTWIFGEMIGGLDIAEVAAGSFAGKLEFLEIV